MNPLTWRRTLSRLRGVESFICMTFYSTASADRGGRMSALDRRTSIFIGLVQCSKTVATTSDSSTPCSNLDHAFSAENISRLVRELETMKPRKSLLASCTDEAAVFVPFCTVNSVPSVLFTLRSGQLNSHRGEVSFPGGKKDPEDKSLKDTAIREMEEELGLDKSCVEVWAQMPEIPDRTGKTAITAVLGYIGEIDVDSLNLNPHEVASVFTIPLARLCNPRNRRYTKHKHLRVCIVTRPVFLGPHRVWGLTAIILDLTLSVFCPEFYQRIFQIKAHGLL